MSTTVNRQNAALRHLAVILTRPTTVYLLITALIAASQFTPTALADEAASAQRSSTEGIESLGEVVVEVLQEGDCQVRSASGNQLKVYYEGRFTNGTQFDARSRQKGASPFEFVLGGGRVIKGWDQGLVGMCVGEIRRLTVPPHLGYSKQGFGKYIGPDETLVFDVELAEIVEKPKSDVEEFSFKAFDLDHDDLLSRDEVFKYMWKMSRRMDEVAEQMETLDAANKFIDSIMLRHDANEDGFLTEKEFMRPFKRTEKREL